MEKTLILIKPDAVQRRLVGEVISRLERKGLNIIGMKLVQLDDEILAEHYAHLADKPFFPRIKAFMSRSPVVAICVAGKDCVDVVRSLCGVTNSRHAAPGTIRGDFAMSIQCNIIHASDSLETAAHEVPRFFRPNELFEFPRLDGDYIYSTDEQN